jgi:hypothetical protein
MFLFWIGSLCADSCTVLHCAERPRLSFLCFYLMAYLSPSILCILEIS